jgi:hypothetical protein
MGKQTTVLVVPPMLDCFLAAMEYPQTQRKEKITKANRLRIAHCACCALVLFMSAVDSVSIWGG